MEAVPMLVVYVDASFRLVQVCRQVEELLGASSAEVRGRDFFEALLPEEPRERALAIASASPGGASTLPTLVARAGREEDARMFEWTVKPRRAGGFLAFGTDVTDRLAADRRRQRILDGLSAFVGVGARSGALIEVNRAPTDLAGLSREDVFGMPFWETPWFSALPEEASRVRDAVTRALRGEVVRGDFRPSMGAQRIDVDNTFGPLLGEGGEIEGYVVCGLEITERKRAAAESRSLSLALEQVNERLAHTLASISDGFFTLDTRDWTCTYLNPAAARLVGRTVPELLGKRIWDAFPDGVGGIWDLAYRKVAATGVSLSVSDYYAPLDVWFEAKLYPMEHGVSVYVRDVTEQKRADRALQESELRFRGLMEQAGDAIFIADERGRYLDVNRAACLLLGYEREELVAMTVHQLRVSSSVPLLDLPRLRRGETHRVVGGLRRKDGGVVEIEANITAMSDGRFVNVARDVTTQKNLERDLRASLTQLRDREARLAAVLNHASDAMILLSVDADGRFRCAAANRAFIETRIGRFTPVDEAGVLGLTFEEIATIYQRTRDSTALYLGWLREVVATGTAHISELTLAFPTGPLYAEVSLAPVHDASGACAYVLWTSRDITEPKRAEAQIRASLAEKETLLREIHHRVKNNLQIISGLLHFHAKRYTAPEDLEAFQALRQRIFAMTLVHERLYQSRDVGRVDFCDYVRALVEELRRSLGYRKAITLLSTADELRLPIQQAMPAGMIVSELVTNALKHAFGDGREGSVTVRVNVAQGRVELCVEDDGVGFPPGFEAKTQGTFGWELVRTLALQLDGTVTASAASERGARVCVSFAVDGAPVSSNR